MNKKKIVILLICTFLFAACSSTPTPSNITETPLVGTLTFAGSTTVQPLAAHLGDAFNQKHHQVTFDIAAGGSNVGIQAIHEGSVDIGMASRFLTAEESEGITSYQIALDVIAVVVHTDNPVDSLTLEQLRNIYLGEITNWKQVGGLDMPIAPYAREKSSGTRGAFDELALEKQEPSAPGIQFAVTAGDMAAAVAGNSAAIGYVGFGNMEQNLKVVKINDVIPSQANAKDGSYILVRPLYLLTGPLSQPLATQFIEFVLSAEGQQLVEGSGWIPAK